LTALPPRQKWALLAFAIIGFATAAAGVWEYLVAGAVHQLVLGTVMIPLVGLARLLWAPRPEPAKDRI
jgi:hypothetical protein